VLLNKEADRTLLHSHFGILLVNLSWLHHLYHQLLLLKIQFPCGYKTMSQRKQSNE